MWGRMEKAAISKAEEGGSGGAKPVLDLGLLDSRTVRKFLLLLKPPRLWHVVMAAQEDYYRWTGPEMAGGSGQLHFSVRKGLRSPPPRSVGTDLVNPVLQLKQITQPQWLKVTQMYRMQFWKVRWANVRCWQHCDSSWRLWGKHVFLPFPASRGCIHPEALRQAPPAPSVPHKDLVIPLGSLSPGYPPCLKVS